MAVCWPGQSSLADRLRFELRAGENVHETADRLDLSWSPQWLLDAGHHLYDSAGTDLTSGRAPHVDGRGVWDAGLRLVRLDDQTGDSKPERALRRRLAGEVAIAALWKSAASTAGVPVRLRPGELSGNARGANFKDFLVATLQSGLPAGWRVEPEARLTSIRGLHMRKDVGGRSSDIVVIDDGNRLVAIVSSKWTWRSDRGTEAAQMVPLMRYRPDVPYALVTAEFPRAGTVSRESIEDRAYHLCPTWVGAWQAIYGAGGNPRTLWPDLQSLHEAGRVWAAAAGLPDLVQLTHDLRDSGTIL
jgi:hypothetical protein